MGSNLGLISYDMLRAYVRPFWGQIHYVTSRVHP